MILDKKGRLSFKCLEAVAREQFPLFLKIKGSTWSQNVLYCEDYYRILNKFLPKEPLSNYILTPKYYHMIKNEVDLSEIDYIILVKRRYILSRSEREDPAFSEYLIYKP